jgi:hypothetical protein
LAGDRVPGGDVVADVQEASGALDPPGPAEQPATLANDLTDVVDDVRALAADFGIRPYRTFLVHAAWSGGAEGEGVLRVVSRREVVPPPEVRDVSGLAQVLRATGVGEEGDVVVGKISPRYSEDDLVGLTPDLVDPGNARTLAPGVDFFWELVEARPTNPAPRPRRFRVASTPSLSRSGMEWRVTLRKQDGDRGRDLETDRAAP